MKREIDSLNSKLAGGRVDTLLANAKRVGSFVVVTEDLGDMGIDAVRSLGDTIKDKEPNAVAVFAIHSGEKLNFLSVCGKSAVANGAHAGNILREIAAICGGKGGGRPDSAMGGGKDIDKIPEALAKAEEILANI